MIPEANAEKQQHKHLKKKEEKKKKVSSFPLSVLSAWNTTTTNRFYNYQVSELQCTI